VKPPSNLHWIDSRIQCATDSVFPQRTMDFSVSALVKTSIGRSICQLH